MNALLVSPPPRSCRIPAAAPVACPTELDARGGSPPHPVKAILAALAAIPPGEPQYVRTRTEPIQLLRELAEKGVVADTRELPDGTWRSVTQRFSGSPV